MLQLFGGLGAFGDQAGADAAGEPEYGSDHDIALEIVVDATDGGDVDHRTRSSSVWFIPDR